MNKTQTLLSAIFLSSSLTFACGFSTPTGKAGDLPKSEVGKNETSQTEKNTPTSKTVQVDAGTRFKGNFEGTKPIEMTLKRDGTTITGSYFYAKTGSAANQLTLRGKIDAGGKFTMQEFDPAGKQTGVFTGTWKEPPYEAGASLEGEWKKTGAKETLFFYASEQLIESSAPEIVTRRMNEANKPKRFEISAEYPELVGGANAAKFNQLAKQMALKPGADFKKEHLAQTPDASMKDMPPSSSDVNYQIELANDEIISVRFADSFYETGAAHGNTAFMVLNYDLKNGREITLADLFKPGSDYLKIIAEYSLKDLQARKSDDGESMMLASEDWAEGAAPAEENYSVWNLTRKGLEITFSPYQVGPYAVGAPTVIVPYSRLKEIAKPDGALVKLMK